ncbi:MAG: hypothetical protein R3249_06140, partial [Nitriliruptorales bacterium]|nr:hypothetical protein [Nitriliruptorales bacterium]
VTNAPDLPTITLVKNAVGSNIGEDDFQASLNGGDVDWDATTEVAPGDHDIAEAIAAGSDVQAGWFEAGDWSCDNGDSGAADGATVSVGLGDDVTCTITNTELGSTLTLHKIVNNDDGGNDTQDDFQARIDGNPVDWDVANDVEALVEHTASEDSPLPGYTAGTWTGDCATDGTVTLDPGEDGHCTITNDDNPPEITVLKDVTNDDGGTAVPADFELLVDGSSRSHGDTAVVPANTDIDVGETGLPGYAQTGISCDDGTSIDGEGDVTLNLDEGEHVTCTIFNDDLPASLTLVKTVVNDDGGDAVADDFQGHIDGSPVDWNVAVELPAGDHTASEDTLDGYTSGDWGGDCAADGSVSLANGEHLTCTITNDDVAPTVTVVKEVINDNGGDAVPGDFVLHVDDADLATGDTVAVDANTDVVVGEDLLPGYVMLAIDCDDGTSLAGEDLTVTLNLDEGEDVTCTIVNDDLPPAITIVKEVINDDGGNATVGDFDLFLDDDPVTSGDTVETTSNEAHEVSETPVDGYAQVSLACVDDDTAEQVTHPVTLDEGQEVTCTIVNDDLAPGLTVFKQVINDDGGTAAPADFTLLVNGNNHGHGDNVDVLSNTDYTVGEDGVAGYDLVDITCTDGTSLAAGAATVTVNLDEGEAVGCTVVNDDQPADIDVVKNATSGVTADEDGNLVATFDPTDGDDETVTYTYEVTNTGDVTLTNVTLVDDILGPIALPQTTLEPGETITVTAVHTLSDADGDTIINVATVTGDPVHGGPSVDDNDDETVFVIEVAPIILVNTGSETVPLIALALLLLASGALALESRYRLDVRFVRAA